MTASKQTTDGVTYGNGSTDSLMTYTYNLGGALVEQQYPSGRVVKNVLDANGDLSIVQSKKNASAGYWNYAHNFTYSAAGAVTSMQLGNGVWESTQFNSRLQPTQIALGTVQNGYDKLDLDFTYGSTDNNGNVMTQTINFTGLTYPLIQTYTYDALNRLDDSNETSNGSQTWRQDFTYDRYGNRNLNETNTTTIPKNCGGAVCTADRYIYNPGINSANKNQMNSGQGYAYDSAGNTLTDANSQSFVYDGENKQVKASNGGGTLGEYFYDGDGKRVKKVVPSTGEVTVFVYDAMGKQIAEYSTIVAASQDAKVGYLTADHLGSPRINTDATGAITSRHDYHPFGEEIYTAQRSGYGGDAVRKQFTGYERDGETGLDFAQARYFSSGFGRFSSPDSVLLASRQDDPQTWNLYRYALNNPLRFIDPNGELEKENGKVKTRDRSDDEVDSELDIIIGKKTYRVFGSATQKDGTKLLIIGEVKKVWVFGDDGKTKIRATVGVGELMATEQRQYETQADADRAKIIDNATLVKETNGAFAGLSHSCNCHGTTFAEGQVWINGSEVPKLLEADGYESTKTPGVGAVGVWGQYEDRKDGSVKVSNVEHSVTVTQVSGGNVTEVSGKDGVTRPRPSSPAASWNPRGKNVELRYWSRKTKG
ncbi:MAG: RHS repeat domain-containing protein [Pyrinomonadaceae bacterium]